MSLTSKIVANIIADYVSALDGRNVTDPVSESNTISLTSGTGANQADLIFHDKRQLAASANEDLDLAGGLTDAFGNTLTFARIKAILVEALSTNTNLVQVSCPASNGFITPFAAASDTVKVRPGGFMLLAAPDATAYAVTAGTGDLLNIANSAGGSVVDYWVTLIGASA